MRLLVLIKKDILLAGKYFWLALAVMIVLPIYWGNYQTINFNSGYICLISISLAYYFFFNNIFAEEDKYKGNIHMLALPYKKSEIVYEKYILSAIIFFLDVVIYSILGAISINGNPIVKSSLTLSSATITCLVETIIVSIIFPLYFRYNYMDIKMLLILVMVIIPTWGAVGLSAVIGSDFVKDTLYLEFGIICMILICSITIFTISTQISILFLKRKNF